MVGVAAGTLQQTVQVVDDRAGVPPFGHRPLQARRQFVAETKNGRCFSRRLHNLYRARNIGVGHVVSSFHFTSAARFGP